MKIHFISLVIVLLIFFSIIFSVLFSLDNKIKCIEGAVNASQKTVNIETINWCISNF